MPNQTLQRTLVPRAAELVVMSHSFQLIFEMAMSVREFLNRSGELHFQDTFLSPRIIREALQKKYWLVTIEESTHHGRYKIIRLLRLYGGPAIFPQARIDITIRKQNGRSSLYWYFVWPEYWVFLVSFLIVCAAALTNSQRIPLLALFLVGCCFALIVFLDTSVVSTRVRKIFKDLTNTTDMT